MRKRVALTVLAIVFLFAASQLALAQQTSAPYPANNDTNGASPNVTLTWTAGSQAAATNGNDVYLGTSLTAVQNATHASPEWMGTQTATSYACSNLTPGTTYYWRVDALNPNVSPYVWTGAVWQFLVFTPGSGQYANGYATWVGDTLTQINPGATPGSANSASIYMAINESSGFQIGVQPASGRHLDHVSVTASQLTSGSNTIPASSLSWQLVGFMQYPNGSDPSNSANFYADILLPVTNFNLPAGISVGLLVTVNTPATTVAGTYTGTVTVATDSGLPTAIPVTVTVWNFALPSGPAHTANSFSLNFYSGIGNNTLVNWGPGANGNSVYQAYGDLMLQYRMNPDDINSFSNNLRNVSDLQNFQANGMTKFCAVKADNWVGNGTVPSSLTNWVSGLSSSLRNMAYFYGYDEKDPPTYGGLQTGFGALAGNSTTAAIPRVTTARIYDPVPPPWLNPLGDMATYSITGICAVSSEYNYNDGVTLRTAGLGYQYQMYHDGESVAPSSGNETYVRSTFWTQYDMKADAFLYYCVNDWADVNGHVPGDSGYSGITPQIVPPAATGGSPFITGHMWGDDEPSGLAEMIYYGENGPLASLRMYNCRDGIQDYEYFYAMTQKINDIEVARELSEQIVSGATGYNADSSALMAARQVIGGWINQPFLAMSPVPHHRSIGNSTTAPLTWAADYPSQVNSFDVYFGTNYTNVLNANHTYAEYMGNQTTTSFSPGALLRNTQYYWRIDELVNGVTWKGYVFSFNCSYGLCGWWKFDETSGSTVLDSSGRGNNGAYTGTVNHVAGCPGIAGNAAGFVHSGYVSIPASTLTTLGGQVSIAFWQYGDPCQPQYEFTFQAVNASGQTVIQAQVPSSDFAVHFQAGPSDQVSQVAALYQVKNSWNHWVFTKNSTTGNMYIYLNGVQWASASGCTQLIGTAVAFNIGAGADGNNGYEGVMDDFKLYDEELTPAAVAALYQSYCTQSLPGFPLKSPYTWSVANLNGNQNSVYFQGGQGLVGHWTFDELSGSIARDDSDYLLGNATLVGGVTHCVDPQMGNCLLFDGSTGYVNATAAAAGMPAFTGAMTISVWTYGDSSLQNESQRYGALCLSAENSLGNEAFQVSIPSKNETSVFCRIGGSNNCENSANAPSPNQYEGQWNHWVFCRDASGYLYMYCNGTMFSANDNGCLPAGKISAFYIGQGCYSNYSGNYYKGKLAKIRIYNYNIGPTGVQNLYNLECPAGQFAYSGLIGRWKFGEGSGSTTADATSFANNGTITNPSWVTGVLGNALDFEGSSYVTIPAAALSPIDHKCTVAFWQKGNPAVQPNGDVIMGAQATAGPLFNFMIPGGTATVYDTLSGYNGLFDQIQSATTSNSQFEGTWNFWAFTKDAWTGQMNIYLNGSLFYTGSGLQFRPFLTPGTSFRIGSAQDGSSPYHGQIDDVQVWNIELQPADIAALMAAYPPLPNPMTWSVAPYAAGQTSISMVATTATASGSDGVSYYFHCTAGGGHDSGWQPGASYTDSNLMPNTQYTYEVMAEDNVNLLQTAYSVALSATTSGPPQNLTVQSTPPTGVSITGTYPGNTDYGPVSVPYNAAVNLTAPATFTDAGGVNYNFAKWQLNGADQPAGQTLLTFTMQQENTAVAVYQAVTWTLTVNSTPAQGAAISGTSPGTTNYSAAGVSDGTAVSLTAPDTFTSGGTTYNFVQWTAPTGWTVSGATVSGNINSNTTLQASYAAQTWTLMVNSAPVQGAVITGTNPGTANYSAENVVDGTAVSLTAPATFVSGETTYNFVKWTAPTGWTVSGATVSGNINTNTTLEADYAAQTWTLTVNSSPAQGAVITGTNPGTTNYSAANVVDGTAVSLSAPLTFVSGTTTYNFVKWTAPTGWAVSGATVSGNINTNTTLEADYAAQTWTLTVNSSPAQGAAITGTNPGTTNYSTANVVGGTAVSLTAPPTFVSGGTTYNFVQWTAPAGWTVSGATVSGNINSNTSLQADYAPQTWTLTVNSSPIQGVVITGTNPGTTNYSVANVVDGASVSIAAPATNPAGYAFSQWTVNGTPQGAGLKAISFTMNSATTALAQYTLNTSTLMVQSTPPTGLSIRSSTGDSGTTSYAVPGIGYGTSVNLQAPTTDPAGYTFSQWTVNGAAQGAGQKTITFTMNSATTALAQYTLNTYALNVQSTPVTGIVITSSGTYGGTTNYTVSSVGYGTSVNLQAPATDPAGYTFSQWTVNGVAQTAGLKALTFTMTAATTAVAQYTLNAYTLTVQSTAPTGLAITSVSLADRAYQGTTNYSVLSVPYGTSVNLVAPATDPPGYTFLHWMENGEAVVLGTGPKSLTFTMHMATTVVAVYTAK